MSDVRELEARVPVGDGVELHADVYLPSDPAPAPALLMRTPYGARDAQRWLYAHPRWYARHGYAVVVQDVRGRWKSDGSFEPYRNERADGAATVAWVAAQEWSDGRVAMYGMSYPGATQLLAAAAAPEGLAAIVPAMTSADFRDGWTYVGGTLNLAFVLSWAPVLAVDSARRAGDARAIAELEALAAQPQPLYDRYETVPLDELLPTHLWPYVPYLREWLEHPEEDDFWRPVRGADTLAAVDVPALHVAGWYDVFLQGTLRTYQTLRERARAPQHLLVGPWAHAPWGEVVGDRDFGRAGASVVDELQLAWFGHWLRGEPLDLPPVRAFVLNAGRWADEDAWPPPRTRAERLYLASGGRANSSGGDGLLVRAPQETSLPDVFVHDPRAPLQSLGGHSCCFESVAPIGPRDQRRAALWNDLLVYESLALAVPLALAGSVRAELYVSLSGASADVVARLVDVQPDGAAYNLVDSVVRVDREERRASAGAGVEPVGDDVFRVALTLGDTYAELGVGHRLRLEVGASSYPAYARNWNGRPPWLAPTDFDGAITVQEVRHDVRHPSALVLPVADGSLP